MVEKKDKPFVNVKFSESLMIVEAPEKDERLHIPALTGMHQPAFPSMAVGMNVIPMDAKAVEYAQKHCDGKVVLLMRKERHDSLGGRRLGKREYYRMGVLAEAILEMTEGDEAPRAACRTICRARVESLCNEHGCIMADVTFPKDEMPATKAEEDEVYLNTICLLDLLKQLLTLRETPPEEMPKYLATMADIPMQKLPDYACTLFPAAPDDLQAVLETLNVRERLEKTLFMLRRFLYYNELRGNMMTKVTKRIEKNQRVFMLQELLHDVKRELGNDLDIGENDIEMFERKLEEIRPYLNQEAEARILEELEKLKLTNRQSPDYTVSRNYLSWLMDLPWHTTTEDILDVAKARAVLDGDHYGLEDVKKRILEFIGVSSLKSSVGGTLLCLIGPPGVGKTSLGRSIATALGRKFFRFSLGGMRDEAEIKGHRRTYIGAQPGKVISAMKVCGTLNPVIMLDEIDKLGSSHQGDPASALLEVLDPEQNISFRDHFLDIPFDLSKVLFIATANVRDTIPAPLLDRMEVINLSGYIIEEKLNIAKRHLIPKLLPRNGLVKANVSFPDSTLRAIIDGYARDSGVRSLENALSACMRKVAVRIADGKQRKDEKLVVKGNLVKEFLGKPVFYDDPLVNNPIPGVAMGLAWTAVGGATLYIEMLAMEGNHELKITGQLGDVMKESTQIALSLVERHASDYAIPKKFFKNNKIHIHVPAGATPKDGPSAGITIASALISGASNRALPPNWAMTGELTLTGRVLPVGGIKEKMIAARRAGVKDVILPKENERDFEEIQERARAGLTPHYVSMYHEVYKLLFGEK